MIWLILVLLLLHICYIIQDCMQGQWEDAERGLGWAALVTFLLISELVS